MDRAIGEAGRYPAVDVLRSLSRSPSGFSSEDLELVKRARSILSRWLSVAELVRLGAYRAGSDPETDLAVELGPRVEACLGQRRDEHSRLVDSLTMLRRVVEGRDAR